MRTACRCAKEMARPISRRGETAGLSCMLRRVLTAALVWQRTPPKSPLALEMSFLWRRVATSEAVGGPQDRYGEHDSLGTKLGARRYAVRCLRAVGRYEATEICRSTCIGNNVQVETEHKNPSDNYY